MVSLNTNWQTENEEGVQFCRYMIRIMKHNGIWAVPRSGTIFRFDHVNKRIVRVGTGSLRDSITPEQELQIHRRMFKQVGWDVVDEGELKKQENQ